jgi:hypothetical protein
MLRLYFEVLTENQKRALKDLKAFSKYGVLAGGTALALQFCHRKSYDLDIFVPKLISRKFLYKVKQYFKNIEILVDTGEELSFVSLLHKVKISFIYYPYLPLYKTILTPYLEIFSWKDIALDKAYCIGRRGEWRDYIDLYFTLKRGYSLKKIIKGAEKKFGDTFSKKLFLSQLCYFGDIKVFSVEFIKEKISKTQLQKFFEKEIRKLKI